MEIKTTMSQTDVKNAFANYRRGVEPDKKLSSALRDKYLPEIMVKLHQLRKKTGKDISFDQAITSELGIQETGDLFHALGMSPEVSLSENAEKVGVSNLDGINFKNVLLGHGNFNAQSVAGIDPTYTFLIGELVMRPIRVGMNYAMQSQNWVADQVTVRKAKGEMPVQNFNNTKPKRTKEGASGNRGTIELTTKPYEAIKHKIIFAFTDEMIAEQPFNILQNTLQTTIGTSLAMKVDGLAMRTLIYGETKSGANYPEGAAQIGVETVADLVQHNDIERALIRMGQLGMRPNSAVLSEATQATNLYKNQNQMVQYFRQAYPDVSLYQFPLPESESFDLLFDSRSAMRKVNYNTISAEQERDIETDTLKVAIRAWAGFVILRRDARVVIDRSVDFASQGFPAWMNYNSSLFGNPYSF